MSCRLLAALPFLILGFLLGPAASHAEHVYLHADFNDKPIDQPILHRGAEFGEPYAVDAEAGGFVRGAPMLTPSFEIKDGSSSASCSARFSFLENAAIDSGIVVVTANLWFAELPGSIQYRVYVFDQDSSTILVSLLFDGTGAVGVEDMDDNFVDVGQYEIGRAYPIAISVDMTGHAYDVWFDSEIVRDNAPISVTTETIGGVTFTASRDEDLAGLFYVDDLHVTDDPAAVPAAKATWGRIRGKFKQ